MTATVFKARVWEQATVTGTGTVTLSGTAQSGYQNFASNVASGSLVCYTIADPTSGAWETGTGTYTITSSPAGTLTRTLSESSTGSLVSFAGNVCNVTLDMLSPIQTTGGSGKAGLVPALNANGYLDVTVGGTGAGANGAHAQSSPSAPTAPSSTTTYAMQGLAGTITPAKTGNILIIISGYIVAQTATTVNNGILYQVSYGTGTAPSNAGALAGTQVGTAQEYTHSVAPTAVGDVHYPFSIQAVVTGLTLATAVWIDLAAKSVTTASDVGLSGISISAIEF